MATKRKLCAQRRGGVRRSGVLGGFGSEAAGGALAEADAVTVGAGGGGGAAGFGVARSIPIHDHQAATASATSSPPPATTPTAHLRGLATLGRAELSTGMPVERRATSGSTARGTGRS